MLGQMMSQPLLISSMVAHAGKFHSDRDIISVETDGSVTKTNWQNVEKRARLLASALGKLGLKAGDRAATIAWNNHRHLEIYFGVSGAEYICHTINPRLIPEQIAYIINHAEDQILFIDKTFLPIAVGLKDHLKTVKNIVLMGARDEEALTALPNILFYEDLIADGDDSYEWPSFDENAASSLCYTSGTTGHPKGVLYSHRSTMLHSFCVVAPDSLSLSAIDNVLPVVPMFHVNAWGLPYAAAMTGAQLTLPGPGLDGVSLKNLINNYGVTLAAGVPTLWQGLLIALRETGEKLKTLDRTIIGGAACPLSLIIAFEDDYNVNIIHAWGMTETSPLGSVNRPLTKHLNQTDTETDQMAVKQGRPPFGIDLRICDDEGQVLPNDTKAQGELQVRGLWVVEGYFKAETETLNADGWFPTGDVANLDNDGFMQITDRAKDVIKSGGEWISSIDLENLAIGHEDILDAAVIGAKHEKWGERPLLLAVKAEGSELTEDELLAIYPNKVAKWWIPDRVIFVTELPHGGTGKLLKNKLRDAYENVLLD
ncbi:MAG: long-chain-fatty-acid--CoA ligase [Alphaproteobacteria bacterium]|nr:long-chain-fatty-acid--CoA ligase [Alphaproteobacteria bacterium]